MEACNIRTREITEEITLQKLTMTTCNKIPLLKLPVQSSTKFKFFMKNIVLKCFGASFYTRTTCDVTRLWNVHKSKAIPVHAVKAYRGVEVKLHSFLTSELERAKCST